MMVTRSHLAAFAFITGYFFLLLSFYVSNLYQTAFFEHGAVVVTYQLKRILMIPYLFWLQYAPGVLVMHYLGKKSPSLSGIKRVIPCFLIGTALWHMVMLVLGLAGWYHYGVMLLLTGTVMVVSLPHLASLIKPYKLPSALLRDERLHIGLVVGVFVLFLACKGAYPTGGHDFFNHYFKYYKEVVSAGNLGPHDSWYQYYYSKGLGMYFLAMILIDPFAIHLVATTYIIVASLMVFDLLKGANRSLMLPLFGVLLYYACYIYTPGRGIFAANGGWGDLEKTHELTAVLILAVVWLFTQWLGSRNRSYLVALHLTNFAAVTIGFGSAIVIGMFYACALCVMLYKRDKSAAAAAFFAGASTGVVMVMHLTINYINTGMPLDQLALQLWWLIDWQKVVKLGYTLELYSHLSDLMAYERNEVPLFKGVPKIAVEFFRLYLFGPLLIAGGAAYLVHRYDKTTIKTPNIALQTLGVFLLASALVAMFLGGRSQPISFFRFSTFNYAPIIVTSLLLCAYAPERWVKTGIRFVLIAGVIFISYIGTMRFTDRTKEMTPWQQAFNHYWGNLLHSAYAWNTGQYSLHEAVNDQSGRVGRIKWGGTQPAMVDIYSGLPPKTKVWSFYNHSYCTVPACNVQMYFSQITSPRWYDIALGSIEEGKKILQSEHTNFFFYSRNVPIVQAADAKDQLVAFYPGLSPYHINDVLGILWTNGWDYLLTWKEESIAPLDDNFMDSWRWYHESIVDSRRKFFPVIQLAKQVKAAAEDPQVLHPPLPDWTYEPRDANNR